MCNIQVKFPRGACGLFLLMFMAGLGGLAPAWGAPTAPIVYVAHDGTGDYNCDGTSDQLKINEALMYVVNNPTFTTVYLKGPATYVISDSVKIGSNTMLTGDSTAVVKLIDNANWNQGKPLVTMLATGDHDITIRGFEIDGNDVNNTIVGGIERQRGTNWYNILYFNTVTRLEICDMYLHDNMNDALKVFSSSYVYYHDNWIHRHGHDGIYAYKCSYAYVYNNEITCRTNSGVRFSDSNHCEAYGNDILQADGGGAGIQVQRSNSPTIMDDIRIHDNVVHGTANQGVWVFGNDASTYTRDKACGVHIYNNVLYDCDRGIQVSGFYDTLIENNVIDNCGWFGIGSYYDDFPPPAGGSGFNTTLRNNVITSNSYGVLNWIGGTHPFTSSYNCFHQNKTVNIGGGAITSSNELLDIDPLYYDKPGHDYHLQSEGGRWNGANWILDLVTSPCIDAGDPASDYSNETFPNGGRVNIGAYGNTGTASRSGVFTLAYAAGANGSIGGVTPQVVHFNVSGSPVTAIPDSGYRFISWSDGSVANPRADINVNVNATALFLAPLSTVWVRFDYAGTESGTEAEPFNLLAEGVNAVADGGTVRVFAGSTALPIRITRGMRLESTGGAATIGR